MKKKINILCFILILTLLILSGCKSNNQGGGDGNDPITPPIKDVIEVTSLYSEVVIKDSEVLRYDFTKLFRITVNGKSINVEEEYINKKDIKEEAGTYNLVCMYKGSSSSVNIIVKPTVYEVNLLVEEVKIDLDDLKNYDFKSLFTCLIDGKTIEITDKMVETNLENKIGTYTYTVTNNNVSKTLNVIVIQQFNVDIMVTYKEIQIEQSKLKDFDFTTLFTIYQDGKYVPVTNQMIDKSNLDNSLPNNTYSVTLNYKVEGETYTKACNVKVVEDSKYTVTTKNVVTYPNGELIDLKSLFEIKKDNQIFPITNDMISGNIDYSKVGNNEITLNFNGTTYKANVEIKLGVIIGYETSDTITILKGTDKSKYPFINDFDVIINGIKFKNISNKYLDITDVDFNKTGTYKAILTLPYNDNRIGLSGVKFEYISKTINYVVVENDYQITLDKNEVIIKSDVTSFDPFNNVNVIINGKKQTLTDRIDYVDAITCYAKLLSEPINLDYIGKQVVKMEIYANGVDSTPVVISYDVYVESTIVVTTNDRTMYTNDEINPKDLFTIKDGNKIIPVTYDMLSGKVDPTKPGAYTVTLEYLGIIKHAKVVVFDKNIKGTYQTPLKTFKPKIGMGSGEDEEEEKFQGTKLADLVINEDGTMILQDSPLELVEGISESKLIVKSRNSKFTLYYDQGVIILDPINEVKLSFNNATRPLVYFNTNTWNINKHITINNGKSYVLEQDYVTYSIDLFRIINKDTNDLFNLGLKTDLVSRINSDSEYEVTWGEVKFKDKFNSMPGSVNSFKLNDIDYTFTLKNENVGKIQVEEVKPQYINKVFKGKIDGFDAELRSDNLEGFELVYNNNKVFHVGPYELGQLLNGGCDYENNIVFIYDAKDHKFSYKFKVNPKDDTFELIERDKYFGSYVNGNLQVFLDGYGTGEINFDTNHFYRTKFNYTVSGNTIDIDYVDTLPSFEYGSNARFTIDPFLNILTVKDFYDKKLIDKKLIIENINDGAIVNIKSFQVGQGADKIAKAEFFNNIEIITKDGPLSDAAKTKLIDTKKIRFSTPGFYEFSITIMVNGNKLVNYYGVEILEAIYKDNKVIGTYGPAVIDKNISLAIDMYGRVTLNVGKITYNGSINISEDNSFIINAESNEGFFITATGALVSDGLIVLTSIGDANFTDYFTVGSVFESGIKNFVVRRFNYQAKDTYLLFDGTSAIAKLLTIELIEGKDINDINTILNLKTTHNSYVVKINSWNDSKTGLTLADKYRGTYHDNENKELILDGFGVALLDNINATYKINTKDRVTLITSDNVIVLKLTLEIMKFSKEEINLDNTLLEGKNFTLRHTFFCHDIPYTANTRIQFFENGKVKVYSISADHDLGENQCPNDKYNPSFASETGTDGTYKVTLNKLEIKVKSQIFTFEITDVVTVNELKCLSTTVDKNAHGYFGVDEIFRIQ